jgi:DNA polymerase III delta subunit
MIHIYYGQDKNNIAFEKQSVLKTNPNIKVIIFDDNYDELISSISQPSLFEESSDILIDNATFLINKTNNDKEAIKTLLNSQNNIFCFTYDEKIDAKIHSTTYHKLTKFNNLSKQKLLSNLIAINKVDFESQSTRSYFESIVANEPFMIKNEYEKLILSRESNLITRKQIDNISISSDNPNIFKLLTFLLQNNKKDLIKLYDNLILNKFQPIDLISTINTQLFNLKIFTLAKLNK